MRHELLLLMHISRVRFFFLLCEAASIPGVERAEVLLIHPSIATLPASCFATTAMLGTCVCVQYVCVCTVRVCVCLCVCTCVCVRVCANRVLSVSHSMERNLYKSHI